MEFVSLKRSENKLLNEINSDHMDNEFGVKAFSEFSEFEFLASAANVSELFEFHKFWKRKLSIPQSPSQVFDRSEC